MSDNAVTALDWVKFVVGAVFFAVILYVHVYIKELSYFILAIPGLLMGIDPVKILNSVLPGGGKK